MTSPGKALMARSGRRPAGTGSAREDILLAARTLFAERGYGGASLRAIAAAAGVDVALIAHYFGAKAGLFRASVELPVDPAVLASIVRTTPRDEVGAAVARFLLGALENVDVRRRLTSLVRAASSEPAAAEEIRRLLETSVFGPIVAALDADQPDVRAVLAASQFIGLVMARHVVGIEAIAAITTTRLVELVGPTLQRYLAEPL
jgi:AcrR family transcriptional regulator